MRKHHPSVLRGVVTGAAAGIAATLIMDQFRKLSTAGQKAAEKQIKLAHGESPSQVQHQQQQKEQHAAQQEDSTEIVARKIVQATGSQLANEDKKKAGQAVHYTFGTLMGIVYAVSVELLPGITGSGAAFGTLLFLAADEVAVPAFQLSPPPTTETAPTDHLQHWAAHIVYGGSLELIRSLVRRLT